MPDLIVDLLNTSVRMATPLMLAGLGGILSERAGIMNIALEGHMLIGAFFAMLAAFYSGSPWLGVLAGGVAGILFAVIMAVICIRLHSNQIVAGTAVNILASGITSFLLKIFNDAQGFNGVITVSSFQELSIPWLSGIPYIGKALFSYKPLTYLTLVFIVLVQIYLFNTKWGLVHRSVGENPHAADTLGINVQKVRNLAVLACGFFCGIAGAYLSVSQLNQFQDEMVSGKGFIAFAALIFGKYSPKGLIFAALLFGAADALQMRIQALGTGVSYHLLQMIPYILTMIALVGIIGKTEAPAADGLPFIKEGGK